MPGKRLQLFLITRIVVFKNEAQDKPFLTLFVLKWLVCYQELFVGMHSQKLVFGIVLPWFSGLSSYASGAQAMWCKVCGSPTFCCDVYPVAKYITLVIGALCCDILLFDNHFGNHMLKGCMFIVISFFKKSVHTCVLLCSLITWELPVSSTPDLQE